jgi:hypothetical protein
MGPQIGKGLLGADVMLLTRSEFFFGLDAGSDGHEAIEATRVVTAVFVLGAGIHRHSTLRRIS